jgi:hypothetical protein
MEYSHAVTVIAVLALLQQKPIIVDVNKQPTPSHDITLDFVAGMFAMAGVFLLAAVVGCVIIAGAIILYKRRRSSTGTSDPDHTTLRI